MKQCSCDLNLQCLMFSVRKLNKNKNPTIHFCVSSEERPGDESALWSNEQ